MNATETQYSNLMKHTVPTLKDMAKRADAPINSQMRKADIVNSLMVKIDTDHDRAIEDNAEYDYQNTDMSEVVAHKEELIKSLFSGMTFKARVAGYQKDNGRTGFLTARQQRRIAKKWKSAISKGYPLDVVMGN